MLELSIDFGELIFLFYSLLMFFFALLSLLTKDTRGAILSFLFLSATVCSFVALNSEVVIAITILIMQISIMSLLLLVVRKDRDSKFKLGKMTIAVLLFLGGYFLIFATTPMKFMKDTPKSHHTGIAEITLMVSLIFIFVLQGLIWLKSIELKKPNKLTE